MYVRVSVIAGAKKERLEKTSSDTFSISVREPAERNLANRRIVALIAAEYGVHSRAVRIISGHRSPKKVLSVDNAVS